MRDPIDLAAGAAIATGVGQRFLLKVPSSHWLNITDLTVRVMVTAGGEDVTAVGRAA